MKVWLLVRGPHDHLRQVCDERPGEEWIELPRDLDPRTEKIDTVDGLPVIVEAFPKEPESPLDKMRSCIASSLEDILISVADGADLAEEIRKVIGKKEEATSV